MRRKARLALVGLIALSGCSAEATALLNGFADKATADIKALHDREDQARRDLLGGTTARYFLEKLSPEEQRAYAVVILGRDPGGTMSYEQVQTVLKALSKP